MLITSNSTKVWLPWAHLPYHLTAILKNSTRAWLPWAYSPYKAKVFWYSPKSGVHGNMFLSKHECSNT